MSEDKATIELAPVLSLEQYRDQLHPHALERYLRFLGEVRDLLLSGQLTEGELKSYLSQEEQIELGIFEREIAEWLVKCRKDSGEASLLVYPYSMSPYYSMSQFQSLLRTAVERKAKQAAEEAEEKERQVRQEAERERRVAALKEINPPVDAEIYLTPEEQQEFLDSIPGAIDAYLGRDKRAESYSPGIWLLNSKASEYAYWTSIIKGRKEKEARQKRADLEYTQYLKEVNDAIKSLKSELAKAKKPKFTYPSSFWAGYRPWSWCELKLPAKDAIARWAGENYISKKIPPELREFVSSDIEWQTQALPHAMYELLGVPCLTWYFGVRVLVEAHLRIVERKFVREFHGEKCQMKIGAEDLGTIYVGPADYGVVRGFTIPVALLATLGKGELEEEGIAVVQQGGSSITFRVRGYDEELVTVKKDFRQFVIDVSKDEGLAQGLLFAWVIDELTAHLLEEKAELPLPQLVGAETSSVQTSDNNSDLMAALEGMGYKTGESKKAIEAAHLSPGMSLEEMVGAVLKILGM